MSEQSLESLLRPELQGQSPYGAPQLDVPVALNTNESSYDVPESVVASIVERVEKAAGGLNRYPDREFTELRAALAEYLARVTGVRLPIEQIWAANGSNEVLSHIVQAFGGPGRTALGFTPSYSMHPIISRGAGTTWIDGLRDRHEGVYDLDADLAVEQVREHQPNVVFVCTPNNPTGTAVTNDVVEAIYDATDHAVVIVDEAYVEFARPGTASAVELLDGRPRLVVSRTMSKAFAFAGARVGYLAASQEFCDAMRLVRLPYHLSSVTQAVALAALDHADEMLGMVDAIKHERDRIVATCTELGFTPTPSDANFVLVGGFADEKQTWQALLDRGILVREVGISHHLRITAGTPRETDAVLAALTDLAPTHKG
ncbi:MULTISPECIES: histidinol-phosphate transaminase [Dermacoccus]|uniref:Histidinol-phosphate aminotransferase n=3 Tax=Dermacoccus TaxID=57495 RepID=A0A417Z8P5_9MICO|nr:histidinol-phosphate transaminase [Dermacoccus abyssi]RHW47021.1 histidinol-phosphate transaminase [Dermacoccus abyssi]